MRKNKKKVFKNEEEVKKLELLKHYFHFDSSLDKDENSQWEHIELTPYSYIGTAEGHVLGSFFKDISSQKNHF